MSKYRALVKTFRKLEIPADRPVIIHASPSFLAGREKSLLGALTAVYDSILTPSFTYQTMVAPKEGPKNNGLDYENPPKASQNPVFFEPSLPPSPPMGKLGEIILSHPRAKRSLHPALSFAGIRVNDALNAQTLTNPLAPVGVLVSQWGWVILLGVDHTANISIHHAEQLAGRKQFTRWALTSAGIKECPNFPGCSQGFNAIRSHIQENVHKVSFEGMVVTAMPLQVLIPVAQKLVLDDASALLCDNENCARCKAVKLACD